MANLAESSTYEAGIYQIETSDPVVGGPTGVSNTQAKQLANRTKYLKEHVDAIESGVANGNLYVDGSIRRVKMANGIIGALTRACILSGPVDGTAGRPSHMSGTVGTLTVAINGAPTPITLAFSDGYDAKGAVDYIGQITVDSTVSISGLSGTTSDAFIYAKRNPSTGAITIEASIEPFVSEALAPSPGAGFWFSTTEQKWYQWILAGGGQWAGVQLVVLGKVKRSSGNIALVIPYNHLEDLTGSYVECIGTVKAMKYATGTPPNGWLPCNGAALAKTNYGRLYDVIGNTYGETSTTFNVPNIAALTTGVNYFIKL